MHPLAKTYIQVFFVVVFVLFFGFGFALRSDKQDIIKCDGCMQKMYNVQIITGLSLMGCLQGVGGEKYMCIYESR